LSTNQRVVTCFPRAKTVLQQDVSVADTCDERYIGQRKEGK
jgi:hypothetical protein